MEVQGWGWCTRRGHEAQSPFLPYASLQSGYYWVVSIYNQLAYRHIGSKLYSWVQNHCNILQNPWRGRWERRIDRQLVRITGSNLDLRLAFEKGAALWDWVLNLWGLRLSPDNCRTPCWHWRIDECGGKNPHIWWPEVKNFVNRLLERKNTSYSYIVYF